MSTTIYKIDPLTDHRWDQFLQQHARASIFHTRGWLEALRRTYGYELAVYTTCPRHQELSNGMVFCQIRSLLTGRRLVSVPFADHCEPLVDSVDDYNEILAFLRDKFGNETFKYIEIRPRGTDPTSTLGFAKGKIFYLHVLDLRPEIEQLSRSFHKDSVQRKIRRAEREGLTYEEGRSEALLDKFYGMLLLTRRRHELPPQPRQWFRNLIACLGREVKIRVASKDRQPIAGILTLRYKDAIFYKYGVSDARFHNLGGMPFLLWKAIQEAKQDGLREFDFGRTDCDNPGLIAFKDHWGTTRSVLTYFRYSVQPSQSADGSHRMRLAKRIFARLPDGILAFTGKLLYRHIG